MAKILPTPTPSTKRPPLEDLAAQAVSKLGPSAIDLIEAAKAGGEASVSPPSVPPPAVVAVSEEPVLADPGVPRCAATFVVERDITVSWGPQTLRLRAGDELSEDSYGDGAIERFRERGVSLVEKA